MKALYACFVGAGDLCFDIGAYVGDKTQLMLDLGASKVVSVEPHPRSVAALRERFGGNSHVVVVQRGLAAVEGTMTMSYYERALAESTFSEKYKTGRFRDFDYSGRVEVQMTTLDALVEEFGIPEFCKIDVEGFEHQVLSGLSQPLPALNYEYAIEFEDEASRCAERLLALGSYEFNFSEGQRSEFALPGWYSDPVTFFQVVRGIKCTDWKGLLWGDVYARRKEEA